MASKFLLLVIMGRYLSFSDIGTYGLLLGASIIYTQAAGWGFGYNLNRRMVSANFKEKKEIFSRQWGVFIYTYIATAILFWIWMSNISLESTGMNVHLLILSLCIIITEHASYEFTKLLIVTKKIFKGNFVLFIHSAGWAFPVSLLLLLSPEMRNLEFIITVWAVFNVISIVIGIWWCREFIEEGKLFIKTLFTVSLSWIKENINASLMLYFSFLASAVLMYMNRFLVGSFLGIEDTGLFTLYWSIENAIYMLAHTGFIQTSYPSMIEARDTPLLYEQKVKALYKYTVYFSILSGLILCLIAPFLFSLMDKPEAMEHLTLFYALLVTGIIRLIATISFYALYARHDDRELVKGMFITLIVSIPFSVFSIFSFGLWGAALSEGFIATTMLVVLTVLYKRKMKACKED